MSCGVARMLAPRKEYIHFCMSAALRPGVQTLILARRK